MILGLRVVDFIEGARRALLEGKAHLAGNANDSIFLSARNCAPLTNRALSQTIARAMRAEGLPKGVALHSGRRIFASERVDAQIEDRLRLGLDTSTESIAAAVAIEMNHRNPDSIYPYVVRAQSRRALEAAVARNRSSREK